jgi:hypothetical protein
MDYLVDEEWLSGDAVMASVCWCVEAGSRSVVQQQLGHAMLEA